VARLHFALGRRISAGTIFLLLAGFAAAGAARPPKRGAAKLTPRRTAPAVFTAKATPARLARGRYLVEDVGACFDCHSPHEYVNGQWMAKPGMKGAGQIFPPNFGQFPPHSMIVARNITSDRQTGIGTWTDAEIEQAIRQGIAKGGQPLFDLMPYPLYRTMTDEDVKSMIVYLRSIPAVHNPLPATKLPFPVQVDTKPPLTLPLPPNPSPEVRRGWYLVHIAGCADCHTPILPNGVRPASQLCAGGMIFHGPFGTAVSLNITPSSAGIGSMTEAEFSRTLLTSRVDGTGRKLSPVMPFEAYKNMREADIRAIYAYLRTVPPVPAK
jgi:mono/diheme cytochrome c family protein